MYYIVKAGITHLNDTNGESSNINSVINHPTFNEAIYDFDISIVNLRTELQFSVRINSIGLPKSDFQIPTGELAVVTGWGRLMVGNFLL